MRIVRWLGLVPLWVAVACGSNSPTEVGDAPPATLSEARARWQRVGPASYTYRFERNCFCPEDVRGPFLVRVEGGRLRSATRLSGSPATTSALPLILTVPEVFSLIEDARARNAASIRVSYDPELGYPTQVDVDYDLRMADEEVYLRLSDVRPL